MTYLPWAQLRSNAFHEIGHCFVARDCGLHVNLVTIDETLARAESGRANSGGTCQIPDLHRAPLFDQITVYRAGIIAADMGGFPNQHGGVGGDFVEIFRLLDAANVPGSEQNAVIARASRRAESILRANWDEAKALVERLIAERTIRFDSPTATRRVAWSEHRAALDAKHGTAAVDQWLRDQGFFHLVETQVRRVEMPLQTRTAPLTVGGDTIEICWGSGEVVKRGGYDPYYEDLPAANADLSWMNTGKCPLLDSHNSTRTSDVLGVVKAGSAFVKDSKGYAAITLGSNAPSGIKDGTLRNISIGYSIGAMKLNGKAADGLPIYTVESYCILECSIVPVPADKGAEILRKYPAEVRG